ncbi:MAG: hypothetical protein IBJ10_04825 [Phycisphaerales bacterium]|nr:hypothetical protein [Phycisphaerales bacterium]
MITVQCSCGAKGMAAPTLAGKTVRCRSCSAPITIPSAAPPGAPPDDIYDIAPPTAGPPLRSDLSGPPPIPPLPPEPKPQSAKSKRRAEASDRSFWPDLALSFGFMFRPANLLVFTGAVILGLLSEFIPVRWIDRIPFGLLCAIYMGTIEESAGGSDDLPNSADYEGFFESIILPIARFMGVSLALGLFAVVLFFVVTIPIESETTAIYVAVAIGAAVAFLRPMSMLMAALGGLTSLVRLDMMARSVAAAIVPYLAVWAALLVAMALIVAPYVLSTAEDDSGGFDPFTNIPGRTVAAVLGVYATLVSMRSIGLLHRHFSDRFPWSFG